MRTAIGRIAAAFIVTAVLAACNRESAAASPDIWSRDGREVSADEVTSYAGHPHCNWEQAQFLHVSWPPGTDASDRSETRQYVRDPEGVLGDEALRRAYQPDATLPRDAQATGYTSGSTTLWLAPSDRDTRAYLVTTDPRRVEAWPRVEPPVGCD
ncbi:hypothetical protein [Micromonospora endolithica]|uniref:DUF3558 domain-containing protein n=1 Tax=Micromonospora endolithica TaxID=230091 RepID=A0A3A9YST6_9ACTN|nr:hypothetical protein [Micromonospora endolithica]RKN39063.1 hypothetical protein D7223_29310 [Micromonospora endolithica]TWJ25559.1 hypothetical protein JD76_05732 [Micromonospora endolithica]